MLAPKTTTLSMCSTFADALIAIAMLNTSAITAAMACDQPRAVGFFPRATIIVPGTLRSRSHRDER